MSICLPNEVWGIRGRADDLEARLMRMPGRDADARGRKRGESGDIGLKTKEDDRARPNLLRNV